MRCSNPVTTICCSSRWAETCSKITEIRSNNAEFFPAQAVLPLSLKFVETKPQGHSNISQKEWKRGGDYMLNLGYPFNHSSLPCGRPLYDSIRCLCACDFFVLGGKRMKPSRCQGLQQVVWLENPTVAFVRRAYSWKSQPSVADSDMKTVLNWTQWIYFTIYFHAYDDACNF